MYNQKFSMLETRIDEVKFEILEHGLLKTGREWDYKGVVSPFNRLYFILNGEGIIRNDRQEQKLQKGHVYLIPAGSCFDYKTLGYLEKLYIHFQIQIVPGMDLFSQCTDAMDMEGFQRETIQILDNLKQDKVSSVVETKALLFSIVSCFLRKMEDYSGMDMDYRGFDRQKEIICYVEQNLSADLKVSQIAEEIGKSYYSLSRNFKNDTGIGLKEYMEIVLMNRARRLLVTTDMRIVEIAEHLGFVDTCYFSKFFGRYEKCSPKEYRKRKMF